MLCYRRKESYSLPCGLYGGVIKVSFMIAKYFHRHPCSLPVYCTPGDIHLLSRSCASEQQGCLPAYLQIGNSLKGVHNKTTMQLIITGEGSRGWHFRMAMAGVFVCWCHSESPGQAPPPANFAVEGFFRWWG